MTALGETMSTKLPDSETVVASRRFSEEFPPDPMARVQTAAHNFLSRVQTASSQQPVDLVALAKAVNSFDSDVVLIAFGAQMDADNGAEYAGGNLLPTSDPTLIAAVNNLIKRARDIKQLDTSKPTVDLTRQFIKLRSEMRAIVEVM
jgi:hypothetical protein